MNNVKSGHKKKQSYANTRTTGKEQYYTRHDAVDLCIEEVEKYVDLTDKFILEPAGGTGEFIKGLQRKGVAGEKILSCDIQPLHPAVMEANYLEDDPLFHGKPLSEYSGLVSITNPPFGRASSLAKRFFNKAALNHDYICYLVPKAWLKWSTMNSLDANFHLVSSIDLPQNCFYLPDDQEPKKKDVLNTVFQVWERRDHKREKIVIPDHNFVEKILPVMKEEVTIKGDKEKTVKRPDYVEGANFQMIVFGHSCGQCEEINQPRVDAKTTTMYFKIEDDEVKEALKKIDFSKYYNNVSYVKALSLQEINHELNLYFGKESFNF